MEEEQGVVAPEAPEEPVAPEPTEENVEESVEESPEELKARLAKAEELANNYKIRAEKAEKASKEKAEVNNDGLSNKDMLFLAKAEIHEDDVDEVVEWAKFKKVSVSEAYKQMKGVLETRDEERKTAQAANTNNVRRAPAKVSDDAILSNARAGKLPESDEDIARLIHVKSQEKG